jgi:CRP-like cAMP-binding protein
VRHRQIGAGTTFHSPAADAELLYFVKRGRVRLYRLTATGRKIILTDLKAPAAFGSMALLGQGMDRDFAEAVDESLVCIVRREELERFLRSRPEVALRLLDMMGRHLWEIERRVEEMAAFTTEQRLASVLQRLADPTTGTIEGLTQQELAETSGTVRQTVAMILGRWRERGLVAIRRRSVRILRPDALAALATKTGSGS